MNKTPRSQIEDRFISVLADNEIPVSDSDFWFGQDSSAFFLSIDTENMNGFALKQIQKQNFNLVGIYPTYSIISHKYEIRASFTAQESINKISDN